MHKLGIPLCLLGLGACGDRAPAPDRTARADTGGTAVVALPADLDFANSLVSGDRYTHEVLRYALFLPLVHYSPGLDYQPALAGSWEFSGDSAVTFRLRDDVYWHDGARTTAYDVAFTFERAADTTTAFPNADWLIGWGRPEVIDSFTVRFPIQRMADPLASVALFPIMPRHLLAPVKPAELRQAPFNKSPVGNGPFRFVEYRPGDRWVLEANRTYPDGLGGRPLLSRLVLRVVPEPATQVAELKAGNVDLALTVPIEQYRGLDADTLLQGITRASRQYAFIAWNTKRPGLSDPTVRRALTMALNREAMLGVARAGAGQIAVSPVGPHSWAYDAALPPLPYHPDSARTLLGLAGWHNERLTLELKHPAASTAMKTIAEMVQSDLQKVGVRVRIRPVESNVLIGQITSPQREFDAVLFGWENDIRLNYRDLFHSTEVNGPFQFASYRNPEVDRIIDQASAEPDPARARPLWHRFQAILREEQPWTVLFHFADVYVRRERLRGVEMDVRGAFVSLPQWSLEPARQ